MPKNSDNIKLNPVIRNGRFYNPNECFQKPWYEYLSLAHSFFHEVLIFIKSFINWHKRAPKDYSYWQQSNPAIDKISEHPNITWIGHATFLIQMGQKNLITDPIFGNATIFFPRIFKPAIPIKQLPKIDYVLISHNHLDHMDKASLREIQKVNPDVKFLVPMGNKSWFDKKKLFNAQEYNWWDEFIDNKIKFTFLPASHWSQRNVFDQNKTLWGSWMIGYNDFNIYFAGDTAYSNHFQAIANKFENIDVALMPIGPCEPREKMCHAHISSEEAGQAFLDLNAKEFIPMHWGTFHFGTDLFDTPIVRLQNWWKNNIDPLSIKNLNIVKFGEKLEFNFTNQNLNSKESDLNINL